MATLNGNNVYLSFNGVNVSGYWTDQIDKTASTTSQETTAGAGATHVERAPGLRDNTISFAVVYDVADLNTYRSALIDGTQGELIFGPESNVVGKPKFACDMILTEVKGPNNTIDKQKVMFELSFEAAAAPTATIEGGSVF